MATSRSATGEVIEQLRGMGLSDVQIGALVGRNSSLIAQAAGPRRGAPEGYRFKPLPELLGPLEEARARLAAAGDARAEAAAARSRARAGERAVPLTRRTRSGELAKIRRPTTTGGRGARGAWTNTVMKRQAARHGAHGIAYPLRDAGDRTVAATVSVDRGLGVNASSGGRKRRLGQGGHFTIQLGAADDVAAEVAHQYGGNFTHYVMAQAMQAGYVSGAADERDAAQHVNTIEVRTYE